MPINAYCTNTTQNCSKYGQFRFEFKAVCFYDILQVMVISLSTAVHKGIVRNAFGTNQMTGSTLSGRAICIPISRVSFIHENDSFIHFVIT